HRRRGGTRRLLSVRRRERHDGDRQLADQGQRHLGGHRRRRTRRAVVGPLRRADLPLTIERQASTPSTNFAARSSPGSRTKMPDPRTFCSNKLKPSFALVTGSTAKNVLPGGT